MHLDKLRLKPIPGKVREYAEKVSRSKGNTYITYLEYKYGEIIERTFSTRCYAKKGTLITEILRRATGGKSRAVCKNLLYAPVCGYVVVYEAKDKYSHSGGYPYLVFPKSEYDVWDTVSTFCGICGHVVNPEMVTQIPEFKYCGYVGGDVIRYINEYRKDSNIEFFGIMGIPISPMLVNKAKKDKAFRKFLWENHKGITPGGIEATVYAYNHHISIGEAKLVLAVKHNLDRLVAHRIPAIRGTKLDRQRILDYVDTNNINYASYDDYLTALKALKYDLTDTKNIYPYDFKSMHDLRAAEYKSFKQKEDEVKRKTLYKRFKKASDDAKPYECKGEIYSLIAPTSITDLINEGDTLSHCVGKMGYDVKMADGISLIMFCRKNDDINTPFVTVEYRLDTKRLNQCYGIKDSKPPAEVVAFVNAWAEGLTSMLKKGVIQSG